MNESEAHASLGKLSVAAHAKYRGKIAVRVKMPVETMDDLSLAYTPGVAAPCLEIQKRPDLVYELTSKWNTVAVITDGSAVLGLGDIGPYASLPVMEGKCAIFKRFADIDSFPLALKTEDADKFVEAVSLLTPGLGGINLEDISAPRCFAIENKLKQLCDIPVFHDDQHGTAVIALAGLINALKIAGKKIQDIKIVINGAGAAGISICKMLAAEGAKNIIICDRLGAIWRGRGNLSDEKKSIAALTNPDQENGGLENLMKGADVFLGVSAPGVVSRGMIKRMAKGAVVFALANPEPEIYPGEAKSAGALVVATGRSDFPNQVNNCLGFPGIFRGALDVRAKEINDEMKHAAAYALASLVSGSELGPDYILPGVLDNRVVAAIAGKVAEAARATGAARI
ncbi:MAG: NAD-dependent malic enzyme [Synergistaceae bacterium]|nr:NAD-dependent malic enzyme [Synergistaceae bacterium]